MSRTAILGVEIQALLDPATQAYERWKQQIEANPPRVTLQTTAPGGGSTGAPLTTNPTGAPGPLTTANTVTTFGGQNVASGPPVTAGNPPPLTTAPTPSVQLPAAGVAAVQASAVSNVWNTPVAPGGGGAALAAMSQSFQQLQAQAAQVGQQVAAAQATQAQLASLSAGTVTNPLSGGYTYGGQYKSPIGPLPLQTVPSPGQPYSSGSQFYGHFVGPLPNASNTSYQVGRQQYGPPVPPGFVPPYSQVEPWQYNQQFGPPVPAGFVPPVGPYTPVTTAEPGGYAQTNGFQQYTSPIGPMPAPGFVPAQPQLSWWQRQTGGRLARFTGDAGVAYGFYSAAHLGEAAMQLSEGYAIARGDPFQQIRAEEQFQSDVGSAVPILGGIARGAAPGFQRLIYGQSAAEAEADARRGLTDVTRTTARIRQGRGVEVAAAELRDRAAETGTYNDYDRVRLSVRNRNEEYQRQLKEQSLQLAEAARDETNPDEQRRLWNDLRAFNRAHGAQFDAQGRGAGFNGPDVQALADAGAAQIAAAGRERNIQRIGFQYGAQIAAAQGQGQDYAAGKLQIQSDNAQLLLQNPSNAFAVITQGVSRLLAYDQLYQRRSTATAEGLEAQTRAQGLEQGGERRAAARAGVDAQFIGQAGTRFQAQRDAQGNVTSFAAVDQATTARETDAFNAAFQSANSAASLDVDRQDVVRAGALRSQQLLLNRQPLQAQYNEIGTRAAKEMTGTTDPFEMIDIAARAANDAALAKQQFNDQSLSIGTTLTGQQNALAEQLARHPAAASTAFTIGAAGLNQARDLINSGRPELAEQARQNTLRQLELTQQDYFDGFRGTVASRFVETQGGRQSEDPNDVITAIQKAKDELIAGFTTALAAVVANSGP
jgi:hypothetical protein